MKKVITAFILTLFFTINLCAQTDGFFSSMYSEYRETENEWEATMPKLPRSHGYDGDYSCEEVPMGNGLILLAFMGLTYIYSSRIRKDLHS